MSNSRDRTITSGCHQLSSAFGRSTGRINQVGEKIESGMPDEGETGQLADWEKAQQWLLHERVTRMSAKVMKCHIARRELVLC